MYIQNAKIIYPDRIESGSVSIQDQRITGINGEIPDKNDMIIDGQGLYRAPGFIDIHIHGAGGHDTMEGTPEALDSIATTIAAQGTTAFLPTTMTPQLTGSTTPSGPSASGGMAVGPGPRCWVPIWRGPSSAAPPSAPKILPTSRSPPSTSTRP